MPVLQAVGASGAAALRPTLQKAANRGIDCVRRAVLMSANESKQTLCVALLREVWMILLLLLLLHHLSPQRHPWIPCFYFFCRGVPVCYL
jgi:hypothetical protein